MSQDLNPRLLKRATYSFKIPEGARAFPESDIHEFKIRAYTLAQEIDASRAAALSGGSEVAMNTELVRRSVVEIDGKPPASLDWLDEQSPAVRVYLAMALNLATNMKKGDTEAFLASKSVEMG